MIQHVQQWLLPLHADMVAWRRHLHQHPELSFQERATAAFIADRLRAEGIAVRAGHHCAQPILRRMGVEATVRPSFAFYNTFEEIDVFLRAVRRLAEGG